MNWFKNKYQHFLGTSANDVTDHQIDRQEIQLSTNYYGDEESTTTGSCENRRTDFIDIFDTSPSAVSTAIAFNTNTPIATKDYRCDILNPHDKYDWEHVDRNALQIALHYKDRLKPWNNEKELKKKLHTIIKGYLTLRLKHLRDKTVINPIRRSFEDAMKECNPIYILEAYSTSQSFSKFLNEDMARIVKHDIHQGCSKFSCDTLYTAEDGTKSLVSILVHHPKFITYSGTVYRGAFDQKELQDAQVNKFIMTNTFLSTSKNPVAANMFSGYNPTEQKFDKDSEEGDVSLFFTFIIKESNAKRRALDMSGISTRPYEEEVLLLPYSVFLITKRETIEFPNMKGKRIEIEFEECDEAQLKSNLSQL